MNDAMPLVGVLTARICCDACAETFTLDVPFVEWHYDRGERLRLEEPFDSKSAKVALPRGWRVTQLPQLHGRLVCPRCARALETP